MRNASTAVAACAFAQAATTAALSSTISQWGGTKRSPSTTARLTTTRSSSLASFIWRGCTTVSASKIADRRPLGAKRSGRTSPAASVSPARQKSTTHSSSPCVRCSCDTPAQTLWKPLRRVRRASRTSGGSSVCGSAASSVPSSGSISSTTAIRCIRHQSANARPSSASAAGSCQLNQRSAPSTKYSERARKPKRCIARNPPISRANGPGSARAASACAGSDAPAGGIASTFRLRGQPGASAPPAKPRSPICAAMFAASRASTTVTSRVRAWRALSHMSASLALVRAAA
ncbi:hypothetical protein BST28156_06952 [Burkholderia stagnalis]|nr:hypothetical protein BST28156_06952 [Burkholderia stagnalis]